MTGSNAAARLFRTSFSCCTSEWRKAVWIREPSSRLLISATLYASFQTHDLESLLLIVDPIDCRWRLSGPPDELRSPLRDGPVVGGTNFDDRPTSYHPENSRAPARCEGKCGPGQLPVWRRSSREIR